MRVHAAIAIAAMVSTGTGLAFNPLTPTPPCRSDSESYRLLTREQARLQDRHTPAAALVDPGVAFEQQRRSIEFSLEAAQRAQRLDPENRLAHSLLARDYLTEPSNFDKAREEWHTVFREGGSVVFPGVIYETDPTRLLLFRFSPSGFRVYTFEQFGVERRTTPAEDNAAFWAAQAGCIDDSVVPIANIPWSEVEEIGVGHWVHFYKLRHDIRLPAKRGTKTLRTFKVYFAGGIGDFHWRLDPLASDGTFPYTGVSHGPVDFNTRLRQVLLENIDQASEIRAPKPPRPGTGW